MNANPQSLIGKRVAVLDKGEIACTGILGDDRTIVEAARVSYLGDSKGDDRDKKLLKYLLFHRHTSPFEMVEFAFRVKAPIFVFRQWMRHRMCLAGDAELCFDEPAAVARRTRKVHKIRLDRLHRLWQDGVTSQRAHPNKKPYFAERVEPARDYRVPELAALVERRPEDLRNLIRWGRLNGAKGSGRLHVRGQAWLDYARRQPVVQQPVRPRLQAMRLRMLNEESGEIEHTRIEQIWQSGIKPVFRVKLDNGYALTMTADHRVMTAGGWLRLGDATRLRLRSDGHVTWDANAPAFAVNGVPAYQNRDWMRQQREAGYGVEEIAEHAGISYHTIRKYLRKFELQFTPREKALRAGQVQRGQRRTGNYHSPTADQKDRIHAARAGAQSNFWKGGVSSERARIAAWASRQAPDVHRASNYICAICRGRGGRLHAHHIDPVWHNPALAFRTDNLVTLCDTCHRRLHTRNLELDFLESFRSGHLSRAFFDAKDRQARPAEKPLARPRKLTRTFARVASIEYCGKQMTYDVDVAGPFHNFVASGFIVHNSEYNEWSGRYSELKEEFYIPDTWRVQDARNKQASQAGDLPHAELSAQLEAACQSAYQLYHQMLKQGVARELARMVLPLNTYSVMIVKMNAHALMHFIELRAAPDAQYEIREYARLLYEEFFKPALPWTAEYYELANEARQQTQADLQKR